MNNLGVVTMQSGDYVRAAVYYKQSLRIYRESGDRRGEWLEEGQPSLGFRLQSPRQGPTARFFASRVPEQTAGALPLTNYIASLSQPVGLG